MMTPSKLLGWLIASSCMSAVIGCTDQSVNNSPPAIVTTSLSAPSSLQPIKGWVAIENLNPRFVVFGEIHGTNEAPQLVGSLAATLAAQGKHILVAVELSASDDGKIQSAWNGPHASFKEELLKAGWAGRLDGIASLAMFDMLTKLHDAKSRGAAISVTAFNSFKDEAQRAKLYTPSSQTGHERAQAENIAEAADREKFDNVLVLVGNLHARKADIVRPNFSFRPMVLHLQDMGTVVSLNMAWSGGTAWNCILKPDVELIAGKPVTTDMQDCSSKPMRGFPIAAGEPHIGLGDLSGSGVAENYDGYFWLDVVSGSPPAIP